MRYKFEMPAYKRGNFTLRRHTSDSFQTPSDWSTNHRNALFGFTLGFGFELQVQSADPPHSRASSHKLTMYVIVPPLKLPDMVLLEPVEMASMVFDSPKSEIFMNDRGIGQGGFAESVEEDC